MSLQRTSAVDSDLRECKDPVEYRLWIPGWKTRRWVGEREAICVSAASTASVDSCSSAASRSGE